MKSIPMLVAAALIATTLAFGLVMLPGCAQQDSGPSPQPVQATLLGRAVLPADTFAEGPPSGATITEEGFRQPPFASQPVQGFSCLEWDADGTLLALSDNGYGGRESSPDYHLRWYRVKPDFDGGGVEVLGFVELTDPHGQLPFATVLTGDDRILTGGDFDPESFCRMPDGSFYVGEEFGPFLVHVDARGRVLEPPVEASIPAPLREFGRGQDVYQSPDHPRYREYESTQRKQLANHPGSGGFEGITVVPGGDFVYGMIEKALADDPVRTRRSLLEFDTELGAFTDSFWFYRVDAEDQVVTELTALDDRRILVVERDDGEGLGARFKRIFLVNLDELDADGYLEKRLVVDLLRIDDPDGVTEPVKGAVGLGDPFSFPFITPESVLVTPDGRLLVVNDNNYPFSNGRWADAPDDNEFILLDVGPIDVGPPGADRNR